MNPAIQVNHVGKRYGRTVALHDVSFDVHRKELFALLGPNGAGKTTLLHILCTVLQPDEGTVHIGDLNVMSQPTQARSGVGVVFQDPSLDDRLTVYENLNFHGLVFGVPGKLRRRRIEALLKLVELAEWQEKLVRTLSSGMKRRVEIARALIHDSRVLFLDEPTVGLDAQSRERIWEYIGRLRSQRELTVVVTTHYIEEVETCDRVCIIDRGRILAIDTPAALKAAHGQQLLRVVPREEATACEIMAAYADATVRRNTEIIVRSGGDEFAEAFLSRFGRRIRRLSVEEPSLESVFLALTGREIRDQAAGARERTLAFGRQGGEHTR
ncbi:MAG TPA: ABC transporter ATP-binding protein [Acetobacteraceae bacterium]|nr:ABC transporter ATP-binding protein [Acetobacteraceae bacterium]